MLTLHWYVCVLGAVHGSNMNEMNMHGSSNVWSKLRVHQKTYLVFLWFVFSWRVFYFLLKMRTSIFDAILVSWNTHKVALDSSSRLQEHQFLDYVPRWGWHLESLRSQFSCDLAWRSNYIKVQCYDFLKGCGVLFIDNLTTISLRNDIKEQTINYFAPASPKFWL